MAEAKAQAIADAKAAEEARLVAVAKAEAEAEARAAEEARLAAEATKAAKAAAAAKAVAAAKAAAAHSLRSSKILIYSSAANPSGLVDEVDAVQPRSNSRLSAKGIQQAAAKTERVMIRSSAAPDTEYVVSKPGTRPIKNLRNGFAISNSFSASDWEGPFAGKSFFAGANSSSTFGLSTGHLFVAHGRNGLHLESTSCGVKSCWKHTPMESVGLEVVLQSS